MKTEIKTAIKALAEQIGHWRSVEAVDRWRKLTTPPADDTKENQDD